MSRSYVQEIAYLGWILLLGSCMFVDVVALFKLACQPSFALIQHLCCSRGSDAAYANRSHRKQSIEVTYATRGLDLYACGRMFSH